MGKDKDALSSPRINVIWGGMVLLWTLLIASLAGWNYHQSYLATIEVVQRTAFESFSKDLVYRRWATMHGGLYAPVTTATPPNPYLEHIPERDITTPSGRKLTLINPAYMTRQVHELGKTDYGTVGHITSLKPLRQQNAPDDWERRALLAFEQGRKEVSSLEPIGDKIHFRYMHPMTTEPGCLKCHAAQGYKLGDIRGGISISIPWTPFSETLREQRGTIVLTYGGIWIVVLLGFYQGKRSLQRHLGERRKAEDALRESEALLARSQEIAHVGSWILDHTTGTLTWSNEVFRLFGLEPQAFGATYAAFLEMTHPDDRPLVDRAYTGSLSEGKGGYDLEHRIVRRDNGEIRYVQERCVHERTEAGRIARSVGMVQDVTEHKRATDALRENEKTFRLLVESAPYGVFVQTRGRFAYLNEAAIKLFGAGTAEALLDKPVQDRFHADDHEQVQKRIAILNEQKSPVDLIVERILRLDGRELFCEVSAVPIHYRGSDGALVFVHDITERKRVEDALQESENRFKQIAQESRTIMWEVDAQGLYTYMSEAAEPLLNYRPSEIVGSKHFYDLHPVEGRDVFKAIAFDFFAAKQPFLEFVNPVQTRDGRILWVSTNGAPLLNPDGTLRGYRGSDTDITERRNAAEEHEKLRLQLTQAQRMESVGRLAGGVAHDFNNMLGVIFGHVETALEQIGPTQPCHKDLKAIQKAAERSANLTRQLLAFARKQVVAPRVLDLNETVEGMLKMLRRLIGENIALKWLPGAGLSPIRMDPSQIDQVLANLCINARDAIADVGRITIETRNVTVDPEYCVHRFGFIPGDFVLLAVSDDGCGMDEETRSHLFEPFFTTKDVGKGTGLGLATVYGIVQQNNGFIDVQSEPGQGATFQIYLPRHRGEGEQVRTEGVAEPARRGHETVLVVEDEPDLLDLNVFMLEKLGYRVLGARNPGEAIRLAKEHAGQIQLLFTDVVMPEMNGRDLARQVLSLNPQIRCLFMSGYTADVIAPRGVLDEGANFIQKPFSRKELAHKLREVLDRG